MVWAAAPAMIRAGSTTAVMTVLLVAFLFEYLPKIYHSVRVLRRSQDASGYVFGTIWWGIALNLMAYFVAAHVSPPRSSPPPSSSPRTLMSLRQISCPATAFLGKNTRRNWPRTLSCARGYLTRNGLAR